MTEYLRLPPPPHTTVDSLETVLIGRRSNRDYARTPLTLAQLGHLLWAGDGISTVDGRRTAPSAGGLYPITLHVAAGNVRSAPPGVYRYLPNGHRLVPTVEGDTRFDLAAAAYEQGWVAAAPAVIVIAAAFDRTVAKYGDRAARYVHLEAGHAAENLLLQAVALGLGGVVVGAFYDDKVQAALGLPEDQEPLYLIPVGHPQE